MTLDRLLIEALLLDGALIDNHDHAAWITLDMTCRRCVAERALLEAARARLRAAVRALED